MIEAAATAPDKARVDRRAWLAWAGVYLVAIACGFNQFKVPPVLPLIIEDLGLDYTTAGLLMGVFTLSGIVLSIPVGVILQRTSLRLGIIAAAASLVLGSLFGAFASASGPLLMGRVLEGVGLSIVVIAAQGVISAWFPDRRRGLPTGLFTSWLPTSSLIAYLVAPALAGQASWRGAWWVGAALAVVSFLAVLLLVTVPDEKRKRGAGAAPLIQLGGSRDPWLLGVYYGVAQGGAVAFRTWFPTFLVVAGLASLQGAALLVSLWLLASVFANPVGGLLADRFRSRKLVYTLSLVALIPAYLLAFHLSVPAIVVLMLLGGWVIALSPAPALTVAMRLPGQPPTVSVGILRTVNNVALFVLPVACGWIYQLTGAAASVGILLAGVTIFGALAGWAVREPS